MGSTTAATGCREPWRPDAAAAAAANGPALGERSWEVDVLYRLLPQRRHKICSRERVDTSRDGFIDSLAQLISDYREGEIPRPGGEHVDRWVSQFDRALQNDILRELLHLLQRTYFNRRYVRNSMSELVMDESLVGREPITFWRNTRVLNIQTGGRSQGDLVGILQKTLLETMSITMSGVGDGLPKQYLYLDDLLCTGITAVTDIGNWIRLHAPAKASVVVACLAAHRLAVWQVRAELRRIAAETGKSISISVYARMYLENRKRFRHMSDTFWPTFDIDDDSYKRRSDSGIQASWLPRDAGGSGSLALFASEAGRQLLEQQFVLKGAKLRAQCQYPAPNLRPLGFGFFGFGFGCPVVTFRNCANTTPLVLWWGAREAPASHPLSAWYPLFPRRSRDAGIRKGGQQTDDEVAWFAVIPVERIPSEPLSGLEWFLRSSLAEYSAEDDDSPESWTLRPDIGVRLKDGSITGLWHWLWDNVFKLESRRDDIVRLGRYKLLIPEGDYYALAVWADDD